MLYISLYTVFFDSPLAFHESWLVYYYVNPRTAGCIRLLEMAEFNKSITIFRFQCGRVFASGLDLQLLYGYLRNLFHLNTTLTSMINNYQFHFYLAKLLWLLRHRQAALFVMIFRVESSIYRT